MIVVANDIVMSRNVGITLKDGQKLVGQNYVDGKGGMPKLTFDFQADNRSSGQGIALAQDSELSDLSIDYTSTFEIDSNSTSCVFNNGYTGIRLNNLNISYGLGVSSGGFNGAIRNIGNGEITLDGTININVTGEYRAHGIAQIFGQATQQPKVFQQAGSVLNISVDAPNAYGLSGGISTFSGTVNIKVANKNGSAAIYEADNVYKGNVNIITEGNTSGLSSGKNTFESTAKLMIQSSSPFFNSSVTYKTGTVIGQKRNNVTDGIFQATADNTEKLGNNLPSNPNFVKIGEFPADFEATWVTKAAAGRSLLALQAQTDTAETVPADDTAYLYAGSLYNSVLAQYNHLIADGTYKGVNLLLRNALKVNFNEDYSSSLTVSERTCRPLRWRLIRRHSKPWPTFRKVWRKSPRL